VTSTFIFTFAVWRLCFLPYRSEYVNMVRKEAVRDCMEGSSVRLLGGSGIRIHARFSWFFSSVSSWTSWGSRLPSRWSLLRITWEWWELLLTARAPLDVGYEMLVKPAEGIWPSPQKGHSASTALAVSSILSILEDGGRFTKTEQDKRGSLWNLSL